MAIKLADIKKRLPKRKPDSHKTRNGVILIIGGSIDYHGAPILAAQAAMATGVDVVNLVVPESNFEVSRNAGANLLVKKYPGEYLTARGKELILTMAQKADVVLIGPGLKDRTETLNVVKDLLGVIDLPIVLDADAISALALMQKLPVSQKLIVTPHHGEFEKLIGKPFKIRDPKPHKERVIRALANDLKMHILLKGPIDLIAADTGEFQENVTGNAGLTKAGTGDVLAGFLAGLMAQKVEIFDAACLSSYLLGKIGDNLLKEKGFCYSVSDLIAEIPFQVKNYLY